MAKKDRDALKAALTETKTLPPSDIFLSTGCDLLDLVVGGGVGMGHRAGTLANYVAAEGIGKSFLMGEMIAKNHHSRQDFCWKYDDVEHRFRFDTKGLYGIQIVEPDERSSNTVEEMDAMLGSWLRRRSTDTCGIYVADSLDQLANADVLDREEERIDAFEKGKDIESNGTYGTATPKFLAQEFFRTKMSAIQGTKTLLIFISQVRSNFGAGAFAKKYIRSGGKALDHACNDIVWLTKVQSIRKKGSDGVERDIGNLVMAKTTKNSSARPYRQCIFPLYYSYGVDNIGANLDYLYDLRDDKYTLQASAKSIPWDQREEMNLNVLKEFMDSRGLLEDCRDSKRSQGRAANLSEEFILDWLGAQPDSDTHMEALRERFGVVKSRDELLVEIGNDPDMQKELTRRVVEKWEKAEASMDLGRPRKY